MPQIPVDQIGCDPKYYPRVNGREDWLTVHRYVEALKVGDVFPPIVVFPVTGKDYRYQLADGKHRLRSHMRHGRDKIEAIIEKIPQSKWFARSVELNSIHGRGLDTGDKAWIAERLNEDGYSDTEVAKILHMPLGSLEKIRSSRVVKLTGAACKIIPQGRSHRSLNRGEIGFLKAPFISATGTKQIMEALEFQNNVSSHDVREILDSFIAVLRSGVIDLSDPDIAAKMSIIRELLA